MKNLIKNMRSSVNMSQEQFADALGTTVLSINRWENGKTMPNRMAQKQLYEFCKQKKIDLSKTIIEAKTYNGQEDNLVLYHGSRSGIDGRIAPISREACDFGRGFYMGTNVMQPLTLICAEKNPIFYTVELNLSGLKVLQVEVGLEWALLIAYYRGEMESAKGTAIYERFAHFADGYDIIVGYIADDRMYTELSSFFDLTLTDTALVKCLSALELGMQYVAITEKACNQIRILKEEVLQPLELSALMDMSEIRRKEGIALAKEIEVKYRRDGRYFDEILKGESANE